VLLNLVSNSVKFTQLNGLIKICVRQEVSSNKKQIRVSVEDTGAGIKKEDQNKLFQMFSSHKNER
jgi:signal transduction histidine kinase